MSSMYPDETTITIDGENLAYPGLKNGKYTSGNPADPADPPSFVCPESINLILDSMGAVIEAAGLQASNSVVTRLREAIAILAKKDHAIGEMMMFDANSVPVVFTAGQFVIGLRYKIVSLGDTNFTLIGAAQNVIGTIFTATGVGVGTGTASSEEGISGAWVDNVTMPGWFACVPANAVWGCPNMTSRFVMGKVVAGPGSLGGTNSYQLSSAQLPPHVHTIDHDHGSSPTGLASNDHAHNIPGGQGSHKHLWNGWHQSPGGGGEPALVGTYQTAFNADYGVIAYASLPAMYTDGQASNHSHWFDMPAFAGVSGNGGFANSAVENRPAYYESIIIRKCK